jgi:hypothetical protein
MKIFELLTGTTQPTPTSSMSPTAPMANTPASPSGSQPAPMQTAGMWDKISNFMTTPQPIGGNAAQTPSAPVPTTTPSGAPAQTSSSIMPRMFGNSAVGQTLDAVNTGLGAGKPPQQ